MSERELRHELERLQAEARALKDELAAPYAPGFVARRDELKARKAAVDAEVQALEAALREAKAEQAKMLAAVQQAREALRAAEQRRLTWEPFLVLPLVFVVGARALGEDALRMSGGAVAAMGLGLLFGDRVLRALGPNAPKAPPREPVVRGIGRPGLGAFVVAVFATLLGLPMLMVLSRPEWPSTGGLLWPGLSVSLVGVMLAVGAFERARAQRRGVGLSLVSGGVCALLLLGLGAAALREAASLQRYLAGPDERLLAWCMVASAALWVPLAAWWVADRAWAPARRAAVPLSLACATLALGACAVMVRGIPSRSWDVFGVERVSPVVLALQLGLYGVALGVRGARRDGARGALRWSGVVACLLALVALAAALELVSLRPW